MFYYNELLLCSYNFVELATDPKLRGIVTTRKALEELFSPVDRKKLGRLYFFDKGLVVIIK